MRTRRMHCTFLFMVIKHPLLSHGARMTSCMTPCSNSARKWSSLRMFWHYGKLKHHHLALPPCRGLPNDPCGEEILKSATLCMHVQFACPSPLSPAPNTPLQLWWCHASTRTSASHTITSSCITLRNSTRPRPVHTWPGRSRRADRATQVQGQAEEPQGG